ncbi:hypothetical protein X805_37450 [Sphaerotilus natans subsp. natans DSM 6575]|uniref:Uncharacterized protein n=1 Tax=Sphaerotilus natans subsp. natans DSM 6575 TaxID=1286631 RepID=A0A059KGR4_9BURK|nr:hypothetical protein X805_37450 [Sphaerotilus natans subsp. natans DSM 6575]
MTDRKNPAVEGSVREAGSGTSAGAPGNGERGEREEGADSGAAIDQPIRPGPCGARDPAVVGRGWG